MKDWTLPLPRAAALAVLSMVAMLALVADASARSTVDLLNDANMRIDGAAAFDRAGFSVAGAGDVNGDGRPDVIVSAAFASHNPRGDVGSGSVYVLYGRASEPSGPVDLADTNGAAAGNGVDPADGYRIDGTTPFEEAGFSAAGAGDVNGDGRDDVIVGAPYADNNSRTDSGSVYVLYGRASGPSGPVDLADTNGAAAGDGVDPAHGFRVDGATGKVRHPGYETEDEGDQAGTSVAGAGDVNGDGRDDVILGAPYADNNSRMESGSVYVLYGRASGPSGPVDLADTNGAAAGDGVDAADGFRIDGARYPDQAGFSVAGAGDVNGDGRDDVIVGAPQATNNAEYLSGSAYVLYGRAFAPSGPVDLADTNGAAAGDGVDPAQGFRIDGTNNSSRAGFSVAGAGDVNGDGRDDVIVGAPSARGNDNTFPGAAFVLYGRALGPSGPVDLRDTNGAAGGSGVDPADGFRISGANGDGPGILGSDRAGTSVAGAGDVNGDGRDDVLVGALYADNNSRTDSGSAYLLYGRASGPSGPVNLADTNGAEAGSGVDPADGFRIDGAADRDEAGFSVAGAGDLNGDGRDDVIVGAAQADNNSRRNSGSAYVLNGLETIPPETAIDAGPAQGATTNDTTPTLRFSSSESGSSFECRVDEGAFASCSSPHTTAALSDGQHTFAVRATDQAENTDRSPATRTFTVDATAPGTAITAGPAQGSTANDTTPTFEFSASESGSSFECRVDEGAFASCSSPHTTAALSDGEHTFAVRATDQADNTDLSAASRTFTVDTTPPKTAIDAGPERGSTTNDNTPTFDFFANEPGSSFECRVDERAFASCSSPHTTGRLSDGEHTFAVRATDRADNTDLSPATRTFTVDTTAPGQGGGQGPDTTDPVVSRLHVSPTRFRPASASTSATAARGTRVSYRLSEAARVRFTVERARAGRRVGGRCVAPRRSNRTRPPCRRHVTVGSFSRLGERGSNRLRFNGRVAGRRLSPGLYRLVAVPRDGAGNVGRARRAPFRILAAQRRRAPSFTG